MEPESIATIIMSISALIGTLWVIRKGMKEEPKTAADVDKSNVETIGLLSKQLKEAYVQIDELRSSLLEFACHRDYQEYLLRGIARLTAALAANELSVPWIPMSYEKFMIKENERNNKP